MSVRSEQGLTMIANIRCGRAKRRSQHRIRRIFRFGCVLLLTGALLMGCGSEASEPPEASEAAGSAGNGDLQDYIERKRKEKIAEAGGDEAQTTPPASSAEETQTTAKSVSYTPLQTTAGREYRSVCDPL